MKRPSHFAHVRDILLLPVTVTGIVPFLIYQPGQGEMPDHLLSRAAGLLVALPGLVLLFYCISLLRKQGEGTLAPWAPTQKLVIRGPYRYCRNPMISGVLFILLGEALFFSSTHILTWAGAFFLINVVYFLVYEEPSLFERFGEDYTRYKKNVPRWIPRVMPYKEN